MTMAETFLPEFDQEMTTTRKLIERVPTEKGEWKPHEKSFSLGHLTQLVATMPGWITRTLRADDINLAGGPGYSYQQTESLLSQFDKHVTEAREAIAESSDEHFATNWSLKMGDKVLFTQQRGAAVHGVVELGHAGRSGRRGCPRARELRARFFQSARHVQVVGIVAAVEAGCECSRPRVLLHQLHADGIVGQRGIDLAQRHLALREEGPACGETQVVAGTDARKHLERALEIVACRRRLVAGAMKIAEHVQGAEVLGLVGET